MKSQPNSQHRSDAFAQAMGRMPDFIDGHQHVHALPGVRRVLAAVLPTLFPAAKPYLRDPVDRLAAIGARRRHGAKAACLQALPGLSRRACAASAFS